MKNEKTHKSNSNEMAAHGLRVHSTNILMAERCVLGNVQRWRFTEAVRCDMGDMYQGNRFAGTRSDGAGTSSGSVTSGEPAGRALGCLSHLLLCHEPLDVFAPGYGCQDDCGVESGPGGTGGGSRDASQPSSICLKVSKETPPEFAGLGAQYGSHVLSL